ncbi:uncharacterized protein DS421_12g382270 [Arachis hypogaea]|nr:uncharacterized protein DS421_12g382270 [Arachis hypogaea]QHO25586.1 uncharacterized protein DS421_12g382270 [Arachis hypogaea]QHO25587.1 uncharacterized protein DS421_12g382270 [Arachis hypogaea]QHO25588.1 uncharacterized protein DS421_12g382270 [Arachis hypogaea]QHO25589.1 uncharacterized protein DS421_12g382270 [Arachis hypogaea]
MVDLATHSLTHSPLVAPHTLTHAHTQTRRKDKKKRKKRGREKRGDREKRREEEGGSCPRRATTRGERVRAASRHRRSGARRSCPVASPPAASSSTPSREMRPREGTSAREETRKKDCHRSASPLSNCYSRRALSLSPLSFNRRHAKSSSPLLREKRELRERERETGWARGAAVNRGLFRHRCCVAIQVNLGCYWSCWCHRS